MRSFSLLPLLLIPLTLFCWYRAYNLSKEANISLYGEDGKNNLKSSSNNDQYSKKNFEKNIRIDNKVDNLFYFIQVMNDNIIMPAHLSIIMMS